MPRVSVIIPNFNHAKYLTQRIESVINQTFQDFEIILMDDLSTDSSRQILQQYNNHPKVSHTVYNEVNSGSTFKQWKKGIELAKGEFVWIAESDDWCEPELLKTLIEGITSDKDCVISYCQSYSIDAGGTIISQSNYWRPSEMMDGKLFIQKHLSVPVAIFNASMVLWRKNALQNVPQELTTFRFCGDWYFWIQLCKAGKVHINGKALNYFRKHDTTASKNAYQSGLNFIEELRIIDSLYKEKLVDEKTYYRAYKKKFIEYWIVKNRIDKTNRQIIRQLFKNPLSSRVNMVKLVPAAIWRKTERMWKGIINR